MLIRFIHGYYIGKCMKFLLIFAWLALGSFFGNSLPVYLVRFEPVELGLVDVGIDRVVGDKYDRLAFDRVMRNRNEKLYASKIDYFDERK